MSTDCQINNIDLPVLVREEVLKGKEYPNCKYTVMFRKVILHKLPTEDQYQFGRILQNFISRTGHILGNISQYNISIYMVHEIGNELAVTSAGIILSKYQGKGLPFAKIMKLKVSMKGIHYQVFCDYAHDSAKLIKSTSEFMDLIEGNFSGLLGQIIVLIDNLPSR